MGEVPNGDQKVRKYLFSEIFYGRQAVSYEDCFSRTNGLGGANPAVNTPRPSRGTRIESCDFIVLIGDP